MTTRYIPETKWRVQLQTGAPKLQNFEKVLDAPSQEIALHRAQAGYPNVQFVNVSASQVDPQSGGPAQQQNANTPTGTGMLPAIKPLAQPRGLTPMWPQNQQQQAQPVPESVFFNPRWFSYPYSLSLPAQFGRILAETAPVRIIRHDGRHSIVLENEQDMQGFLVRLAGNRDRRGVKTIVAGIRSSLW